MCIMFSQDMYELSIAALFVIAKTRKQPKRPSTGKWLYKVQHIQKVKNYAAVKKREKLGRLGGSVS